MYYFGRIIGAFFNQLFRWLFWNKTGQKLLFSILIVFILFCFIKLGEVSAVEEVQDVNYEVYTYYDSIINDAIIRLGNEYLTNPTAGIFTQFLNKTTEDFGYYFYYGNADGSSYNGAVPLNKKDLYVLIINKWTYGNLTFAMSSYDYSGITGYTMYGITHSTGGLKRLHFSGGVYDTISNISNSYTIYAPQQLVSYSSYNWANFVQYINDNNTAEIKALLQEIQSDTAVISDALTNTNTTSETDSFVDVDTSSTDSISSTAVDNVASNVLSNLQNKVNNYNPSTDYSFVWNIMGTTITFHSNMIYNLIKDTFLYDLIQMLWYFITGHYCFAFLSNLIHSIKDGSILDGFHPNEVISKEVL